MRRIDRKRGIISEITYCLLVNKVVICELYANKKNTRSNYSLKEGKYWSRNWKTLLVMFLRYTTWRSVELFGIWSVIFPMFRSTVPICEHSFGAPVGRALAGGKSSIPYLRHTVLVRSPWLNDMNSMVVGPATEHRKIKLPLKQDIDMKMLLSALPISGHGKE